MTAWILIICASTYADACGRTDRIAFASKTACFETLREVKISGTALAYCRPKDGTEAP